MKNSRYRNRSGCLIATQIEEREYTYQELVNILFSLADTYEFLKVFAIGKSVQGRSIYAAELGISPRKVFYAGAFHGMERLTALTLMLFLEEYCAALRNNTDYSLLANARDALFGKSIVIVPIANPDGYEIALRGASAAGPYADQVTAISGGNTGRWNANVRGVDINHNFDAGFAQLKALEQAQGTFGPAPARYGGESPESEPETLALTTYCREHDVRQVLAIHSQGEEIYWQYGNNTPERGRKLAELYATASGYRMATPTGTASYGGFKDWFIEEFGRPGFTIEIGKGTNPLPPSMLYEIYDRLRELFLLSVALN